MKGDREGDRDMINDGDDLYAVLGVSRDADGAAIRAGYLHQSKRAHPDAGGSSEQFERVKIAFDVLKDAERRRQHDATGAFDASTPFQIDAAALNLIMLIVDLYLQTEGVDLEKIDLIDHMSKELKLRLGLATAELSKPSEMVARIDVILKRLKHKQGTDDNVLASMLKARRRDLVKTLGELRRRVDAIKRAQEILGDYEFDFEQVKKLSPRPPGYAVFTVKFDRLP